MANASNVHSNRLLGQRPKQVEGTFARFPAFGTPLVISPSQSSDTLTADLTIPSLLAGVRLNLKGLQNFEAVTHQFQAWGVTFANAIALYPSNPAYMARSGGMVLMGAPKSGWLEATFLHPVEYVSSIVTSSKSTVMVAYDHNNQQVTQTSSLGGSSTDLNPSVSPNMQLSLYGDAIYRITLYTFDSQLIVDEFSFRGCLKSLRY